MEKVIKIGSKVIYKGAWGTQPEKEVTIEGMQLCEEEGEKYGTDVEEIHWDYKDYGVYDLSDGHWCYGYQIVSLVEEPEPEEEPEEDDTDYKLHETLILMSADMYQDIYNMTEVGGYDVAVDLVRKAALRFEKKWAEMKANDKEDKLDYILELEKFEEEELARLRDLYDSSDDEEDDDDLTCTQ